MREINLYLTVLGEVLIGVVIEDIILLTPGDKVGSFNACTLVSRDIEKMLSEGR